MAYYKKSFSPDWKVECLDVQLLDYLEKKHFPGLLGINAKYKLSDREKQYFLRQLKIMICSNRSQKDYPYLQDFTDNEWKVVRDPVTDKCSKVTIDRFLDQPVYGFLFAWFATVS